MYEDKDDIDPVYKDTHAEAYEEFLTLEIDEEFELYVSDDNELQSVLMYSADILGLKYDRTQKKTYLE